MAEGAAGDHLDEPERSCPPDEPVADAGDWHEVTGVPVLRHESRDVLQSPASGAKNSSAPPSGAACSGEGPEDRSPGGLQALRARARHPGHPEAPAALPPLPAAEAQDKQQLLSDT